MVSAGIISQSNVDHALRLQQGQESREPIGTILVKLGYISERDVAECLAKQYDLQLLEQKDYPLDLPDNHNIPANFLEERNALVLQCSDEELTALVANPQDHYFVEALKLSSGKRIKLVVGVASEISRALQQSDSMIEQVDVTDSSGNRSAMLESDAEHLRDLAGEAPIIKMVNRLLQEAVEKGASDIHIEPFENKLEVRFRIDGLLRKVKPPSPDSAAALISRLKLMANLNIAEHRLPQDGRIKIRVLGNEIDLRLSTVPTIHGESVVLRLLHRGDWAADFNGLGFNPEVKKKLLEILGIPQGVILLTGPTGSGKTTSLYAALNYLNTPERKIITVEDPVEYNIDGINQIQVKPKIGLTFANTLRSILRQDPDVIMVGEMRDAETAKIAVESALTGHLVLSTLHTNDAASSITRLLDMGVEDYLLTSTINAVIAQRLVRTLCQHCREEYEPSSGIYARSRLDRFGSRQDLRLFRAVGCQSCDETGYIGRTTILELMVMTDSMREVIAEQADSHAILQMARNEGMRSLFEDGVSKVLAGVTTVEEVLRVTEDRESEQFSSQDHSEPISIELD
jgi:general secretion pathway protein E